MNKTRQQELTRWLKQQSIISRRWLMISRLLGVASGLLIVAQAWFLARILHRMVMENIPATALLLPLTLLVLIFVLRAWVVWLRERVGFQAGQHIRYEIRRQVLDRLQQAGPAWIQGKPAGSWAAAFRFRLPWPCMSASIISASAWWNVSRLKHCRIHSLMPLQTSSQKEAV